MVKAVEGEQRVCRVVRRQVTPSCGRGSANSARDKRSLWISRARLLRERHTQRFVPLRRDVRGILAS